MGAWAQGWAGGAERAQHSRDRKEMLSDQERQLKASDLINTRNNILSKLPTLLGPNGEKTDEYNQAYQSLTQAQQGLGELYHPEKAPGALQKDWHFLLEKMHGIPGAKEKSAPAAAPQTATSQTPAATLNAPASPITTPALPGDAGQPATPSATLPGMSAVPKGATPTMAVANPKGLVQPGNIPIWNRPSVLNANGTHSSELSISIGEDKGVQALIPLIVDGKFLTPDGKMPPGDVPHNDEEWQKASPEWKALKMRAIQHYRQTGQHLGKFGGPTAEDDVEAYAQVLHNRGSVGAQAAIPAGAPTTVAKTPAPAPAPHVPWAQAQVLKQRAAAMQKAQHDAKLLAAGAPPSPNQQVITGANAANAGELAKIRGEIQNYKAINPDATEEEVSAYASSLMPGNNQIGNWERVDGTLNGQPYSVSYDKKRGVYKGPDNSLSSTPPENFKPSPKASGTAAQNLADYKSDPSPNKGTFAQWLERSKSEGKGLVWDNNTGQIKGGPNGRRYNPWDTDLPPDVKGMFASQAAFMAKKQANALQLAAARGSAAANARMIDVSDPKNPGLNIVVPAGLAYKLGFHTPNGAYYSAMTNMLKDATSGPIGNEFVSFGTALQHADQLGRAAIALHNNDSRSLNYLQNGLSTAFGDPAVTNFDVVSQVYTGEITKAINAGHVTQSELQEQIIGAINNFKTLLNSKINNRVPQIQSILGRFGMDTPFMPPGYTAPAGHGASTSSVASKKKVSLAKAKLLDSNKGKTEDQIRKEIESHGYEVIP
jgi:hypothetical protein